MTTEKETVDIVFTLSAAIPKKGPDGGLVPIAGEERTIALDAIPGCSAALGDWMRRLLTERDAPLGLYIAECGPLGADDDPRAWICEESLAWYSNGAWPVEAASNPHLKPAAG